MPRSTPSCCVRPSAARSILRPCPLPRCVRTKKNPALWWVNRTSQIFGFWMPPAARFHAAADRMIDEFFEEPVENPLIRYALVLTGPSTCIVAIKCSHVVPGGLAIFFHIAVIANVYTALARGETPNLGEPCPCDEAYIEDQAHCASPRFQKDMAFWQEHLARLPEKRLLRVPCRADPMCWVKAAIKSMCFLKKPHAKQRRLSPRTRSVLRCFLPAFTR